jgi:Phosphotransferase enzyme family
MADSLKDLRRIECRLIVIDAQSMRILTTAAKTDALLPRQAIPAYSRIAEALTESIEQRYGLNTIQLALLPGAEGKSDCAVHEIVGPRESASLSLPFSALQEIASSEFAGDERATVRAIMNGDATGLGRFARIGWIDELLAKTSGYRRQDSMPAIRQLNQSIDFCLLSLADSGGHKMWFKAVGEPNRREYALTVELTRRFPANLPRLVAVMPEWNGWVMEHAEGVPLNESRSIERCEQALIVLAVMQKEVANCTASLLSIGAKNWTCARIASLLEPFFQEARCAMLGQTSTRSKPLSESELYRLKGDIHSALHELVNAGIPETLVHADIGHGNIIVTPEGPVFLDWAETAIGHPFLSAEYLLADFTRSNPTLAAAVPTLRSHYAALWKTHVRQADLDTVTLLSPAVAAFAYAVFAWDENRNWPDPSLIWPHLRSLLRRTKRELEHASEFIS